MLKLFQQMMAPMSIKQRNRCFRRKSLH